MKRRTRSSGPSGCAHVAALHTGAEQLVRVLVHALEPATAPGQPPGLVASDAAATYECLKCGCRAQAPSKLRCGHPIVVDRERLELYCVHCHDYVYADEFDGALQLYASHAMMHKGRPLIVPPTDAAAKRARTQQHQPAASVGGGDASTATTTSLGAALPSFVAADGFPLGLRGLNNLGNTCFMNSVLQVLFQVPLLRNFYLGEGHDPSSCRRALRDKPCLSCQMDGVFAEVYSGRRSPFSPADFLYHWWLSDEGLAGYQQHDAHEFFLSLLDKLERGSLISDAPPAPLPAGLLGAAAAARGVASGPARAVGGGARASPPPLLLPPAAAALARARGGASPAPEDSDVVMGGPGGSSWRDDDDGCSTDSGFLHGTGGRPSPAVYGARAWAGADPLGNGLEATPEPGDCDQSPAPGVSLVSQTFMGLMRSDVTCCSCSHVSSTFQSFTDLSLDLHLPQPPHRTRAPTALGGAETPLLAGAARLEAPATPSPTPPPSDYLVAPSGLSGLASGAISDGPNGSQPAAASSEGSQEGGTELSQTLRRGRNAGQAAAGMQAAPGGKAGAAGGDASDSDGIPSELGGAAASQSSQQQRNSAAAASAPAGGQAAAAAHERPRRASVGGRMSRGGSGALGDGAEAAAAGQGQLQGVGARTRHAQVHADDAAATNGLAAARAGGGLGALVQAPMQALQRLLSSGQQQHPQQHPQQQQAGGAPGHGRHELDAGEVSSPARPSRSGPGGLDAFGAAAAAAMGSSGLPAASAPASGSVGAPAGADSSGGTKGKGRGPVPRVTRCGECHTCRNKHLKKACERNRLLREQGIDPLVAAPAAAAYTAAASGPLGAAPAAAAPRHGQAGQYSSYDPLAAAALRQGLLKQRDGKGRFIPKQQLARYAAELVRRGLMAAPEGVEVPPLGPGEAPVDDAALHSAGAPVGAPSPGPGSAGGGGAASAGVSGGGGGVVVKREPGAAGPAAAALVKKPPVVEPPGEAVSLLGCLRRFIRPDRVTGHTCGGCGATGDATKQVSLRRLPPVLCLHIKRFKLDERHNRLHKLKVPLSFPLGALDMSPFLSSSVLRAAALPRAAGVKRVTRASAARAGGGGAAHPPDDPAVAGPGPDGFLSRCCYDLFGVVSHLGEMSAGHYVAYVKAGGAWYKCDDAWVLLADGEAEVARCQAYMLFYGARGHFPSAEGGAGGGGAGQGLPELMGSAAAAAVAAAARAASAAASAVAGRAS